MGFIYRYSYQGKCYIGSTTDIKKRKEEHKEAKNTKFSRAVQKYGYNNLKFEIIDTINYSDLTELHEKENQRILEHNSINNGWNSRLNYRNID